MPNLATKQYTTVAEQIYDTVKSNPYYSEDSYNAMVQATGSGDNYLGLMYSIKDKDMSAYEMNLDDYKYLDGEQKIQYLDYHVNQDHASNEFKQYKEYISEQILIAKEEETYANLGFLGRVGATAVGFTGKLLEGFLKIIEGVGDTLVSAIGGVVETFGGDATGFKELVAADLVGDDLLGYSGALESFNRKYTYMDKGWFGETLSGIAFGLGQLAINLVPGVGQIAYFTGMVGNSVEEAVQANPNMSIMGANLYGLTIGAVEFGLERMSMGLFGKTGIDNLIFKGTSTLAAKTTGSAIKRLGSDFVKEGIEEMASEIAGDIAFMTFVSQDPAVLSQYGKNLGTGEAWGNVLTAGLIGGVIGGTVAGIGIGGTHRAYLTSDNHLITYNDEGYAEIRKAYKTGDKSIKRLTRGQTYEINDAIAGIASTQGQQNVTRLQAKYGLSIEQLKKEYETEYNEAVLADKNVRETALKNTMWLSNIVSGVGEKQFEEGLKLYQTVADKKFELLQNWAARQKNKENVSKLSQEMIDKFETQHPGVSIKIHENDLNSTELSIQKEMAKLGKNVVFVDFASETGEFYASETIDEDTIFLQKDLQDVWSLEQIQTDAIKHELAHSMVMYLGALSPRLILRLKKLAMERLGNNPIPSVLDDAYANEKTNIKLAEVQASTLAKLLIDDALTINALFLGEYPVFKGIFTEFKEQRAKAKAEKDAKGKLKYRELNVIMNLYKATIKANIQNPNDIDEVLDALSITDPDEIAELVNGYLPNEYYGKFTLLKDQFSSHGRLRIIAEKNLAEHRKNKEGAFDYSRAFDMDYYEDEFVKNIMSRAPTKSFKYNLQTYLRTNTNFMISQANKCLVETIDLSAELKADILSFTSLKELQDKATNVKDLFGDTELTKAFQTTKDKNALQDIRIVFKPARSSKLCDMTYNKGNKKNPPTITVYTKEDVDFTNDLNRNTFLGELMNQVTLAMADAQGLANGTSPDIVAMSLEESVSDADLDFLAKNLLTEDVYAKNKGNKLKLVRDVAYAVYRSTDGAVLKANIKVKKTTGAKPRYATNENGFINVYGGIRGYGIFKHIFIPQPVSVYDAMAGRADYVTLSKRIAPISMFYKVLSKYIGEGYGTKELMAMGVSNIELANDIINHDVTKTDLDHGIADGVITSKKIINAYIETYYNDNEYIRSLDDAIEAYNIINKAPLDEKAAQRYSDAYARKLQGVKTKKQATTQKTDEEKDLAYKDPISGLLADKTLAYWIQYFIEKDIDPNSKNIQSIISRKASSIDVGASETLTGVAKAGDVVKKDDASEEPLVDVESIVDDRATDSEIFNIGAGLDYNDFNARPAVTDCITMVQTRHSAAAVITRSNDIRTLAVTQGVNETVKILKSNTEAYTRVEGILQESNMTLKQYLNGILNKSVKVYIAQLIYDLRDNNVTQEELIYMRKNMYVSLGNEFYDALRTIFEPDDFAKIRKALLKLENELYPKTKAQSTEKVVAKETTEQSQPAKKPADKDKATRLTTDELRRKSDTLVSKEEKTAEKTPVQNAMRGKTEVSDEQKVVPKKAEKVDKTEQPVKKTQEEKTTEKEVTKDTVEKPVKDKTEKEATKKKTEPVTTEPVEKPVKEVSPKTVEESKPIEEMTNEEVVEATPPQKNVDDIAAQIEMLREQIAANRKAQPKERVKMMWVDLSDNNMNGQIDGTTITFKGECYDKSVTGGLKHSSIRKLELYDVIHGKKVLVGKYEDGRWIVKPDATYNVYVSFIAASRRMLDQQYATNKSDMSARLETMVNTKSTRIIQNQVKHMSNVDRTHQINNLRDFTIANWSYIDNFTVADFEEFIRKCLDPTRAFTGAEQNNILMMCMVLKERENMLKNSDSRFEKLFDKLNTYLNEQISLSGQQLSLWSRMVKESNFLLAAETDFFEAFGKPLEIPTALRDEYKQALRERRYAHEDGKRSIKEIETDLTQMICDQIPDNRFNIFEKGIPLSVRWDRFKNVLSTFNSFRYMSMLSNPATHMMNFVSNVAIAGMDSAAYRIMNLFDTKTTRGIEGQYQYRKGKLNKETLAKVNEKYGDLLDSISETGKYDVGGGRNDLFRRGTRDKVYGWNFLNKINNIIFGTIRKIDKIFVRPALAKELARLIDANNIDMDTAPPQVLDVLLDNATRRVMHSYLRDDSKASLFIESICNTFPILGFFIKMFIPFIKVMINITRRVLEFTPIGLARGIKQFVQIKTAVKSGATHGTILDDPFTVADYKLTMARASVGSAMLAIGYILAALGVIGFDDDDEYNGIVLRIGPYKLSLKSIAPGATPLLLGAALMKVEDTPLGERLLNVFNDATIMGSFNDLFVYRTNLTEYISVPSSTYVTQFIPAVLRSFAKAITPVKKQVSYDYTSLAGWFNTTYQKAISAIPIARNTLPDKINPYTGEPELEYNSVILPWINIVVPSKISKANTNDMVAELREIGATTTGAQGSITINGEKILLKGQELSDFRKMRAEYVNSLVSELLKSKKKYTVKNEDGSFEDLYYANMTDAQKKRAVSTLYDKATDYAKVKYWLNSGHKYYTSNKNEYSTLKKVVGSQGIVYRTTWNKSKYVI